MAVIFMDSGDHYASNEIEKKWDLSYAAGIDNTNPRRPGGRHLYLATSGAYVKNYMTSIKTTLVLGTAFKLTSYGNASLIEYHRMGEVQCSAVLKPDGSISVYRGDSGGTELGNSGPEIVPLNAWFFLVFKALISDTGTYEVHRNKTNILSGSGDTKNSTLYSGCDSYSIRKAADIVYVDDIYVDDANIHEDCRIDSLFPNGVGDQSEWMPSPAVSNYQNVDETTDIDDDTTYNYANVLNKIDTYEFENIVNIPDSSIIAVALNLCVRKDDAGQRKFKPVCRMVSTNYLGDEKDFWDTWKNSQYIWESPPDNPGGSWTEAKINNSEWGIKLTV